MLVYTYGTTRSEEKKQQQRDLDFCEVCIESVKIWINKIKKKSEKE